MAQARLLGPGLRRLVGASSLEVEGGTVREVLRELVARCGPELQQLLYDSTGSELQRDARVLVNGRSVALLDGIETSVGARDAVTLYFFGARSFPGG
jgi:molybdopterin converting factor small subunit